MKVPIILFVLWAAALVGIVVCFGFADGAYTMHGYHVWTILGWVSVVLFLGGIVWYFANVNTRK